MGKDRAQIQAQIQQTLVVHVLGAVTKATPVHAIGMDPNVDNMLIASIFGVKLEPHGFIDRQNTYGVMGATSRPGVFVAGAATGPETIDDSIAQGHAAAMSALGARAPAMAAE